MNEKQLEGLESKLKTFVKETRKGSTHHFSYDTRRGYSGMPDVTVVDVHGVNLLFKEEVLKLIGFADELFLNWYIRYNLPLSRIEFHFE